MAGVLEMVSIRVWWLVFTLKVIGSGIVCCMCMASCLSRSVFSHCVQHTHAHAPVLRLLQTVAGEPATGDSAVKTTPAAENMESLTHGLVYPWAGSLHL